MGWDFSGGPVVKASPFNARGVGSIPGWGIKISQAAFGHKKLKKIYKDNEIFFICS